MKTALRSVLVSLALLPGAAFAHTGAGHAHGFVQGFAHPIGGLDHLLAMVAVGLFAAYLGGRALWLVPTTFVGVTALGGLLGVSGAALPYVELGIALSVVVFGLLVALRWNFPVTGAMAIAGVFAVFHGYAHGTELPENASGLAYGIGFMIATALLHLAGIAIGLGFASRGTGKLGRRLVQTGGGVIALAGVVIAAQAITSF
jgi:urease accessory protein